MTPTDPVTIKAIIKEVLAALPENRLVLPPHTYMGFPVDLNNLDVPIRGFVVKGQWATRRR